MGVLLRPLLHDLVALQPNARHYSSCCTARQIVRKPLLTGLKTTHDDTLLLVW